MKLRSVWSTFFNGAGAPPPARSDADASSRVAPPREDAWPQALAWLVHTFTALGLIAAAGIAVLIVRGGAESFRWAFVLMMVATVIDAVDGSFARKVRVKEVLPQFDGRVLDDLIDFQTYTALPLLLLWRAGIFPGHLAWLLLFPLLASAYGFSQVNAKTADGFFLGFPSYWNVVAFYLYFLHPPLWLAVAVVVTFAVLTFVPTPYLYPSRGGPFARTLIAGAVVWTVMVVLVGLEAFENPVPLALISLIYPVLYLAVSLAVARGRRNSDPKSRTYIPDS